MSDDSSACCCPPRAGAADPPHCPQSRTPGTHVPIETVKALLQDRAMRRLTPSQHAFCPDPLCPVVYFTACGEVYVSSDVRVPVWQKQPSGARTVCYCFGENEADIRHEIERTGLSKAVARVRGHIKAQRCACEVRNPRGVCCLADVAEAVRSMAAAASSKPESHGEAKRS